MIFPNYSKIFEAGKRVVLVKDDQVVSGSVKKHVSSKAPNPLAAHMTSVIVIKLDPQRHLLYGTEEVIFYSDLSEDPLKSALMFEEYFTSIAIPGSSVDVIEDIAPPLYHIGQKVGVVDVSGYGLHKKGFIIGRVVRGMGTPNLYWEYFVKWDGIPVSYDVRYKTAELINILPS